jgi:LPS O-antigen subunit length determinant protein (WzzB/FepE family)
METKWIIIAVIVVCAIALVIYLIKRNQKDKEELIKYLNESEIEEPQDPKRE